MQKHIPSKIDENSSLESNALMLLNLHDCVGCMQHY